MSEAAEAKLAELRDSLLLSIGVLVCTVRMVAFVAFQYEFDGIHSSLGSFLMLSLVGCIFEAHLSTYDGLNLTAKTAGPGTARVRLRRLAFFVLFIFV